MGNPVPSGLDRLRERFEKAEGQILKDGYRDKPNQKFLKARCPHCGYVVQYSPKENFKGDLRCPNCSKTFHVIRLDDF